MHEYGERGVEEGSFTVFSLLQPSRTVHLTDAYLNSGSWMCKVVACSCNLAMHMQSPKC